MRLFALEIKRLLKTRMTWILLAAVFVLAIVMAWLPTTFPKQGVAGEDGKEITISGFQALNLQKEAQAKIAGKITEDKIKSALTDYQTCIAVYGDTSDPDFPISAYNELMLPYASLRQKLREIYSDPQTGLAPDLLTMDPALTDEFYERCRSHLTDLMNMEQKNHPDAIRKAEAMYQKVEQPFVYYPGFNSDSLDYQMLYLFLLLLICTIIAAPVFSSDYQTGADDILRCAKYGKLRLALVRAAAGLLIGIVAYLAGMAVFLLMTRALFGAECLKSSVQLFYSGVSLLNMNLEQLQFFIAWTGALTVAASISLTLFLSSKCKNIQSSLILSFGFCLIPVVIGIMTGSNLGNWIGSVLPASGAALNSSLLYKATSFEFLHAGSTSFWTPAVLIAAAAAEIPIFAGLALRAYCVHGRK